MEKWEETWKMSYSASIDTFQSLLVWQNVLNLIYLDLTNALEFWEDLSHQSLTKVL